MRRTYAFEAETLSDEVKSQLEKVEDVVDAKCDSPEACEKILDKIEDQKEKFDDALKTMAGAAKDCKDGKCDDAEMAAKITPKMAELKEVAKEVGVASEGETVTEDELKDVKDYLEGAEEIVETKKDELENGGDSDDEGETDEATEAFIEDTLTNSMVAMESAIFDAAMEGANTDTVSLFRNAMSKIKASRKEMKAAAKAKDYKTAASKANECAAHAQEALSAIDGLDDSVGSAVISNLAYVVLGALLAAVTSTTVSSAKVGKAFGPKGIPVFARDIAVSAGKGAAVAGGGTAAIVGVNSAVAKFYKRKGALNEDGTVDKEKAKLSANDVNVLISGIRGDLNLLVKTYKKKAEKYSSKPSEVVDEATEAMIADAFDSSMFAMEGMLFDAAMEGTNVNAVTVAKDAMKAIKGSAKEMKKAAKAKDFGTAKAKAEEAASHAAEAIKAIDGLDQSVGSAVIGGLVVAVINLIKYSAVMFVAATAAFTGAGAIGAVKDGAKLTGRGVGAAAKSAATTAGKAGIIGGAAGGAGGTGLGLLEGFAMLKYAKKKGATPDEDGNVNPADLKVQPNELNLILAGIKSDLGKLMQKYSKLASKYGSRGGAESEGGATESFTGFIAACESMQFGTDARRNRNVPFLFN